VARIDLTTFRTAEIIEIPNSAGNHSSPFTTDNGEYIVAGTRFSVPLDNDNGDVPINTYKQNFKGTVSFIHIDPATGGMKLGFQVVLPVSILIWRIQAKALLKDGSFFHATIQNRQTHCLK
jgi:nitrous-oxide reductase